MAEHQSTNRILSTHPAHLWVGSPDELMPKAIEFLQEQLCPQHGCRTCTTCSAIAQQQHHAIMWLHPEKNYVIDDLEIIFKTIAFQLEPHEKIFFVIQKADYLTPVCANSLLKSLEEPPAGYHFLLLTHRLDPVLPTIKSRCIIQQYASAATVHNHPLITFLCQNRPRDPLLFLAELEKATPSERETLDLLDHLLSHWISFYQKAVATHNAAQTAQAQRMISLLQHSLEQPPMPGSSKLFWKNLLLQIIF